MQPYNHGDLVVLLADFDDVYRKGMIAVVEDYGWPFSDNDYFYLKPSQHDSDTFEFPASCFRRATKAERFLYKMSGWSAQLEPKEIAQKKKTEETDEI